MRRVRLIAIACLGLVASTAQGAEQDVEFEAKRVEIDPDGQTMHLEGDVVVTSDRYRLTSDDVRIRRTPRGVWVDGKGRVAFCPCPEPPVSFGFQRALVAPPTDLVLEQPTFRVGSVPVAWLPYLWLRSRRRWGLLPPKLAWRAQDGFLAGLGGHAPLDGGDASLDLRAAGYLRGGVELESRLSTRRTTTSVRFDHLGRSMLIADARGVVGPERGTALAWDVDVVRGARAASGPLLLETAARRFDRVRVGSTWTKGVGLVGLTVAGDARRGGALDTVGAAGPGVHLGVGGAVGSVGTVHEAASIVTRHDATLGALSAIGHDGHVSFDGRPGIFAVTGAVHSAALGVVEEARRTGAVAAGIVTRAGLPLHRRFDDGVDHHVEPFIEAGGKLASADGALPWVHGDGRWIHAAGGVRSALGSYASRAGLGAALRGGVVGSPTELHPVASARATADADAAALSADAVWFPSAPRHVAAVVRGRLGALDGVNVAPRLTGAVGGDLASARVLNGGGWNATPVGWLDRDGWNAGASTSVPWTDWLATGADMDVDITHADVLGVRGSAAYRHRCDCLALTAWGGYRRGRRGVDVLLTIDLSP
jgi:hypothetical protein